MSDIIRGTRKAGNNWQSSHEDPTITILGQPDWFFLPDDEALGHYRGLQARRVGTAVIDDTMAPPLKVHVLSIASKISNLVIYEQSEFTIVEVPDNILNDMLAALPESETIIDEGVVIYCDDPEVTEAIRDGMDTGI